MAPQTAPLFVSLVKITGCGYRLLFCIPEFIRGEMLYAEKIDMGEVAFRVDPLDRENETALRIVEKVVNIDGVAIVLVDNNGLFIILQRQAGEWSLVKKSILQLLQEELERELVINPIFTNSLNLPQVS